jgi:serine/threonine protein kinase
MVTAFDPPIIHGDLKAVSPSFWLLFESGVLTFKLKANILVTPQNRLCLCDFGFSRMLSDDTLWVTSALEAPGTIHWMAPELFQNTQLTVTRQSDIYALAITIVVRSFLYYG